MRPSRLLLGVVVCCVVLFALWPLAHWVSASAQGTTTSPYDPLLFRGYSAPGTTSGQYFSRIDVIDASSSYFISTFDPTVNDPNLSSNISAAAPLIAVTPDGSHLYAAITAASGYFATVQIFDTTTFSPLLSSSQAIQLAGATPLAIAASPDGKYVDVLDSSCSLTSINRSQGDKSASASAVSLPAGACISAGLGLIGGIAFSPDSSIAFVTVYSGTLVTVNGVVSLSTAASTYTLDVATGSFTAVADGGDGVAINPSGQFAYLLNNGGSAPSGSISVAASPGGALQTVNGASYFSLDPAFAPYSQVAISNDGSTLLLPGYDDGLSSNALALVDTATINASAAPTINYVAYSPTTPSLVGIAGFGAGTFATEPKGNHVAAEFDSGTASSVKTGIFGSFSSGFTNITQIMNANGTPLTFSTSDYLPTLVFTPVSLAISPVGPSYVNAGAGPVQFTLTDLHDTGVTWQVNGIAGGDSSVGTIVGQPCSFGTCLGVYTPPGGLTTTQTFTVTATSVWNPTQTAEAQVTVVVVPPLQVTTASPLPSGQEGVAYSTTLAASGGTPPYTWTVAQGSSLPPGLNLTAGVISGIPTVEGSFQIKIQVVDTSKPQQTATATFQLALAPAPLTPSPMNPPSGQTGHSYNAALTATGGVPPYTWTLVSSIPAAPWLQVSPSGVIPSGVLTGTPPGPNSYSLKVQVTDGAGNTAQITYSFTIGSSIATVNVLPENLTLAPNTDQTFYAQDGAGNYTPVKFQQPPTFAVAGCSKASPGSLTQNDDKSAKYSAPASIPTDANGNACVIVITAISTLDSSAQPGTAMITLASNGLGACCVLPGNSNGVFLQVVVPPGQNGKVGAILNGLPLTGPDSSVVFDLSCAVTALSSQGPAPEGIGCVFQNKNSGVTPGTVTGANPIAFCTIFTTGQNSSSISWFSSGESSARSDALAAVLYFICLICLGFWAIAKNQRRYTRVFACFVLLMIGVVALEACGEFSKPNVAVPTYHATQAGSYVVTITAKPTQATSSNGTPFVQSQLLVPLTVQ